jgi:FMN phosphatase YigB (HAD superfamily)
MTDTILFDLDGTLARFNQDEFITTYFSELSKVFVRLGLDAEKACKGVWVGTKAMVLNDGAKLNTRRFWDAFSEFMGIEGDLLVAAEAACDDFYSNEFNIVKSIVAHSEIPARIVRAMADKGYTVALATNPLFPPCAVDSRLGWIGLEREDFSLITHYENSTFCKPNPAYYHEVLAKIGKTPEQCLMVGNNPAEDMCASELGMEVFLVTDYMENEAGIDISQFRNGRLEDMEAYLMAMPDLTGK